jgi:hypothetical protein
MAARFSASVAANAEVTVITPHNAAMTTESAVL